MKIPPRLTSRLRASAVALLFFLLARPAPGAPATQPVWQADQFMIGFWCGPTARFTTLERYQEIKDAGFTVAFPPCGGVTSDRNQKILDYCQQLGLKAFVADRRIPTTLGTNPAKTKADLDAVVAEYSKHPALAGYFIADEPGPGAFPGLRDVVAYLREKDPKHFSYINLLPNYAGGLTTEKNYERYVRAFIDIVKPPVISYDHYTFASGHPESFFANLAAVRKLSIESGIPFWNIVLVTQCGPYRYLTEPELRFEAMNTIAYGAKGLLWFTYWSPAESDHSLVWKQAMVDIDGTRDPHYDMVKRVNEEAQTLGSIVLKSDSAEILPKSDRAKSPIQFDGDALVTLFHTPDRKTIAMIVNGSWQKPLTTDATLRDEVSKAEAFDLKTHQWKQIGSGKLHINLAAGDAMLIRW